MKDTIGQEINLGDIVVLTKNSQAFCVTSFLMVTKFGNKENVQITRIYTADENYNWAPFKSYCDAENVVVITEQVRHSFGNDFLEGLKKKVSKHIDSNTPAAPKVKREYFFYSFKGQYFVICAVGTTQAEIQQSRVKSFVKITGSNSSIHDELLHVKKYRNTYTWERYYYSYTSFGYNKVKGIQGCDFKEEGFRVLESFDISDLNKE